MALNTTPIFTKAPSLAVTRFTSADTTTAKTIFTAGADGARLTGLHATSQDTVARRLNLYLRRSSVDYLISSSAIGAATAGPPEVPTFVSLLNSADTPWVQQDVNGNRYIDLQANDELYVGLAQTMTAAKNIDVFAQSATFSA
jgi:hypothetical protein